MKSFKRIAGLALLAGFVANSGSSVAADAGSIQNLSGSVTITNANNQTRSAAARDLIQSGDRISTGANSEAVIRMADESVIALRGTTTFQINGFRYENKPTDSSFVSVVRGTARFITGLMGKQNPNAYKVLANTATIGIRGTDFEVSVMPEDSADVRAGVYDYVRDGSTNIQLATGQTAEVAREITAFAPENLRPGEEPLQLLPQPPLFLRQGGGMDAVLQNIRSNIINTLPRLPR